MRHTRIDGKLLTLHYCQIFHLDVLGFNLPNKLKILKPLPSNITLSVFDREKYNASWIVWRWENYNFNPIFAGFGSFQASSLCSALKEENCRTDRVGFVFPLISLALKLNELRARRCDPVRPVRVCTESAAEAPETISRTIMKSLLLPFFLRSRLLFKKVDLYLSFFPRFCYEMKADL